MESLYSQLSNIGVRVSAKPKEGHVDIEMVLIRSCQNINENSRLLGLLLSWVQVHGEYVIPDKLKKLRNQAENFSGQTIWALDILAIYATHLKMRKWKLLLRKLNKTFYLEPKEVTKSRIRIKGQDEWLENSNFMIGKQRIREKDVESPEILVKHNLQFKNRVLYGADWRSDIITAITLGASNPSQVAKDVHCSYEPAYRVWNQIKILKQAKLF